MEFQICLLFFISASLNFAALKRVRLARLNFVDGIVIGMTYYLTLPMIAVLTAGRIGPDFIEIPDYRPFIDTETTFVIIGAICCLSLLRLALPISKSNYREKLPYTQQSLTLLLLFLYFSTTVAAFVMRGSGSGHWFRAGHELMTMSSSYVVLMQVSNITRTTAFGALAAWAVMDRRAAYKAVAIGACIALLDTLITFNRISIVYFLLLLLVHFRRRVFLACTAMGALLLSGAYVSSAFTQFRGLVNVYGYERAFEIAFSGETTGKPFVDQMNGVFESINITVFNFIVQHHMYLNVSASDVIIRPLTNLMPRAIFPDRPQPFGLVLGKRLSGSDAFAANSTLLGEFYAGMGVAGFAALVAFILLYHLVFSRLMRANPAYGAMGALVAFAWWRFDSSFVSNATVFAILLHFLLVIGQRAKRSFMHVTPQQRTRRSAPPQAAAPAPSTINHS